MKKVIATKESDTIELRDVSENKIYCTKSDGCRSIYKLHRIDAKWMFCGIDNSNTGSIGTFGTLREIIEQQMRFSPVYEFDTRKEFLEWALENTK